MLTRQKLLLMNRPAVAAAAPAGADIILVLQAGDVQATLSNGNHTVTLNGPEPGFQSNVTPFSKSLGALVKAFWQIQVSVGSNGGSGSGMIDGAFSGYSPDQGIHSYLFSNNGARYHNGASIGGDFGFAAGNHFMIGCWDGTRVAYSLWEQVYGWGGGGGTATDPKTGSGGMICSDLTLPAKPFVSTDETGTVININGGERAFDATVAAEIAALRTAGFVSLSEL